MSDDLKTLVAQEVAKQLAAIAADQTTKKVLDFLASPPVVPFTASRALTVNDLNRIYVLSSPIDSSLPIELTMPTAAECVGKSVSFINIGGGGSQLTIKATNGEHIYGGMSTDSSYSTLTLASSCGLTLVTDGYNWITNSGVAMDGIVEIGGYANETISAWYKKLQSGMVWMGGTANLNGSASIHIALPTALKENDWPIVVATPLWNSSSDIPHVSYGQTSTTGFTLYSNNRSVVVVWHAYGYLR